MRLLHRLLALDVDEPLAGQVGGDADLGPVQADLVLDHLLDLAEVGGHVEVEVLGQLGHLGLGPAHLQLGVVLGDLLADLGQLAAGVLDLGEVVVVGLLVHLELGLVLGQVLLGLLQLQGELGRRLAVAGLQVGLDLGLQVGDVRLVGGHLPADALDQGPVLLQPLAALLELLDGQVVLVLHLGDRVGRPEEVGQLVDLGRERAPELAEDHRCT